MKLSTINSRYSPGTYKSLTMLSYAQFFNDLVGNSEYYHDFLEKYFAPKKEANYSTSKL